MAPSIFYTSDQTITAYWSSCAIPQGSPYQLSKNLNLSLRVYIYICTYVRHLVSSTAPCDWNAHRALWIHSGKINIARDGSQIVHACWEEKQTNVAGRRSSDSSEIAAQLKPTQFEFLPLQMLMSISMIWNCSTQKPRCDYVTAKPWPENWHILSRLGDALIRSRFVSRSLQSRKWK